MAERTVPLQLAEQVAEEAAVLAAGFAGFAGLVGLVGPGSQVPG